ncbi:MAG: c-type cytochrome [Chloroflexota bacterium]
MFANLVTLLVLFALIALFVWLAWRAWRSRYGAARWLGAPLAGLLAVVLILVTAMASWGLYRSIAPRDAPLPSIAAASGPAALARGQMLGSALCASCHSRTGELPMTGGANLSNDVGLPLGNLYPPNLTPAGDLPSWSDAQIARAVGWGVHRSGRPLSMPVTTMRNLADDDLAAIIGFLRAQPAAAGQTPENYHSLVLGFLVATGIFGMDYPPLAEPVVAPAQAPTAEYGEYFFAFQDCRLCHGPNLDGRVQPPTPAGPDLRPSAGWTTEQFVASMRTGMLPSGRQLQPPMPWRSIRHLGDEELTAMHRYLGTLR